MGNVYDTGAARRPTSLTLNEDLVAKARALGGSLSERVERLLAQELEASALGRPSLNGAIDSSNAFIAEHGLVGDEHNGGRFG